MNEVTENTTEVVEQEVVTKEFTEVQKGLNNLVKAQKIAIDAVVGQTGRTAEFVKTRYNLDETKPVANVVDAAKDGIERVASIQKGMLDAAEDRIESRIEKRQNKVAEVPEPKAPRIPLRGLAKNGLNRVMDGQEELINLGQKQSELVLEGLAEITRIRPRGLTRGFGRYVTRAIRNVIDTQERLLQLNAEYVKSNRALFTNDSEDADTGMTEFAREGVDAVFETSKQLLNVAKEQTDSTMETLASKTTQAEKTESNEWIDLAENGVERVVKGQKASVDFSREIVNQLLPN